jgi:hypothetical protein
MTHSSLTVTGSKQQFTSADLGEEESILPIAPG